MDPKRVRGSHRRLFTKSVDNINELLAQETVDDSELEVAVAQMCERYEKMMKLDDDVFGLAGMNDDALNAEEATAAGYSKTYHAILNKIKKRTSRHSTTEIGDNSTNSSASRAANASVRLPKLSLPFFDGNLLDWLPFWDIFSAAVHNREDMTGATKFDYLSAQLKGDAEKLIRGFQHTSDNYTEAVTLLEKTYGDKQKIVRGHLYHVFDLPTPRCNANELMDFRNEYEGHLRSLTVLGINVNAASHVYTALLTRKLPLQIRDNINRATRKTYLDLTEFRNAIDEEIDRLSVMDQEDVRNERPTHATRLIPMETTVSSFPTITSDKVLACHYCDDNHKAIDCHAYPTVEQRRNVVKTRRLCYNCLSRGHAVGQCRSQWTCSTCRAQHHSSLCNKREPRIVEAATNGDPSERNTLNRQPQSSSASRGRTTGDNRPQQPSNATSVNLSHSSTTHIHSVTSTILPTAMIGVESHGTVCYLRTLFDQGAQRSFILKDAADQLNTPICGTTEMTINGFNCKGESKVYDVIHIDTITNDGHVSINVIVVDSLPGNITMHGRVQVIRDVQLRGVSLADPYMDDTIVDIQLIIGADHYFDYVYTDKVADVAIIPSNIGCLLSGRTPINGQDNSMNTSGASLVVTALHIGATEDDNLDTELSRLWSLDTIGIQQDTLSNDELAAVEDFEANVTYSGSGYVARLPWKPSHPTLPTNEVLARKRLRGTLARLRRTPDILNHYDHIVHTYIDKNFIEKVDENSKLSNDSKIHYLPHHEVKKDSATTPIRVVFDCSAKMSPSQPSLNNCLLTGPSLVQDLGRMLLLFRLERYAAIADIEKAYLQVGLDERDRDSTRFLWPDNPQDPESKIAVYRFKVVLFGATCSQFLLNATLRHHLGLSTSQVAQKLLERLYIDNLQTSEKSEESLICFYEESKRLLKDAGFILREWHSNSSRLRAVIAENGDGITTKSDNVDEVPLLGMRWKSETDKLYFPKYEESVKDDSVKISKRHVVSQASKIFDPLGWLTPVTIKSRMYIQKLWKENLNWDEPLDDELRYEWFDIERDLISARHISQDRHVVITDKTELHCFSDASMKAYGAVIYIVNGTCVQLLTSKSRVTPTRSITLPQLELTAANVAAKLTNFVINIYRQYGLNEQNVHMWSDSQIVLCWIASDKPLKTYVKNRIDDINSLLPDAKWRYVPSKDNPADLLSRGMSYHAFEKADLWWHGPEWITQVGTRFRAGISTPLDEYIDENHSEECISIIVRENIDGQSKEINMGYVQTGFNTDDVIGIGRYSNYEKLIRITAYVMMFCNKLRIAITKQDDQRDQINQRPVLPVLSVFEIQRAELYLVKVIQNANYSDELRYLRGGTSEKRPNLVKQLRLQIVDGVIRCTGRINEADLPWETKYPLLLPPRHHFTQLLIHNAHKDSKHGGVGVVLTKIRERWWIPAGRQRVKDVIHRCVRCKRHHARSYPSADEPHLPAIRVSDSPPFTVTGVDYTGALLVKDGDSTRKVYIALFTCATTRAIHLEIVQDNKCETFLHALRRFIARRSCPRYMLSDNASTFISTAKILAGFKESPNVQNELLRRRITWKFIPVRAPWFGGFWERLIGLTKSSIKKTIGNALIDVDELQSLVSEIESVVNNRPLSYFINDLEEALPLSPSMLLHGRNLTTVAAGDESVEELITLSPLLDNVSRKFRHAQKNREALCSRWKHEYLTNLREQHAYTRSRPGHCDIKVGDIVLIHDDVPRVNWNLGRVNSLNIGNDGEIRSVELTTQHGITVRPIQRLYPLESQVDSLPGTENSDDDEVVANDDSEPELANNPVNDGNDDDDANSRPRRLAATTARENIRSWCT